VLYRLSGGNNEGDAVNIDICISRTLYRTLKGYGIERMTRWTLRMARRRMRLARTRHETFHV